MLYHIVEIPLIHTKRPASPCFSNAWFCYTFAFTIGVFVCSTTFLLLAFHFISHEMFFFFSFFPYFKYVHTFIRYHHLVHHFGLVLLLLPPLSLALNGVGCAIAVDFGYLLGIQLANIMRMSSKILFHPFWSVLFFEAWFFPIHHAKYYTHAHIHREHTHWQWTYIIMHKYYTHIYIHTTHHKRMRMGIYVCTGESLWNRAKPTKRYIQRTNEPTDRKEEKLKYKMIFIHILCAIEYALPSTCVPSLCASLEYALASPSPKRLFRCIKSANFRK